MRKISNISKILILTIVFMLLLCSSAFAASTQRTMFYWRVKGDVDGDGKLDPADTRLMSKAAVKTINFSLEEQLIADMDGDGELTFEDVRLASRGEQKGYAVFYYVYGDLNHDWKFDSADVRELQRYFAGLRKLTPMEKCIADVDCDGEVSMEDLRLFSRRNVNIIKAFPVEGDISGNGTITTYDAKCVLQYSVKNRTFTEAQKRRADVNRDGKVDSADARIILRRAYNLE